MVVKLSEETPLAQRCTFREVFVDWILAEISKNSTFRSGYADIPTDLENRINSGDVSSCANLNPDDVNALERAWRRGRGGLLQFCPLGEAWSYSHKEISTDELRHFGTIWSFRESASFVEFAEGVMAEPSSHPDIKILVEEMLEEVRNGGALRGSPIAFAHPGSVPVLIEGYKRCIVALETKARSVGTYLCVPPPRVFVPGIGRFLDAPELRALLTDLH